MKDLQAVLIVLRFMTFFIFRFLLLSLTFHMFNKGLWSLCITLSYDLFILMDLFCMIRMIFHLLRGETEMSNLLLSNSPFFFMLTLIYCSFYILYLQMDYAIYPCLGETTVEITLFFYKVYMIFHVNDGVRFERDMCAICIENYQPNDGITALPCGHGFHENCIGSWSSLRRECPTCRTAF